MKKNKKKPESTPKPSKGITISKMQIPPTPKPSKGIIRTLAEAKPRKKKK